MTYHDCRSLCALACSAGLCLLVACTSMTNADSAQNAAPPDELAGSDASAEGQDEARQGNIVERFWAPFDNAVDDFNRDINKGDSDANESDE